MDTIRYRMVLVRSAVDALVKARAAAVKGDSRVTKAGSHGGNGRNSDNVRDQASLLLSEYFQGFRIVLEWIHSRSKDHSQDRSLSGSALK